jgi:hypothetical protein
MGNIAWPLLIVAVGVFVIDLVRRWYRRRVAARLGDKMLLDVLKAKDAFRR